MDAITSYRSAGWYAGIALASFVVWRVCIALYNVFLHPLRNFPGPVTSAASSLPFAVRHAFGQQSRHTQRLHDKYGPVVRVAPNHISFTDPQAWRDIYGHKIGGKDEMDKPTEFVRPLRDLPSVMINAPREEHQRFRRALSHGFSDASMRKQEPLIKQYVDLLIENLRRESGAGAKGDRKPLRMDSWYNYTTFDIMGELIFGESFHCLENSEYHPWIAAAIGSVRNNSLGIALSAAGLIDVVQWIYRLGLFSSLLEMQAHIARMLRKRLAMDKERNDLFEGIIKHKEDWNLSFDKLRENAFILVLAGSETTSTTLSGATYLLLENPEALARLTREVRSTFASADEITITSVNKLTYMLACLNEAMRMYPPVGSGLVRTVPAGGDTIAGHFVPGGTWVDIPQWSANHSADNWEDPWTYKPERFMGENGENSKNKLDALQPFSFGPRNCIGKNLAYAEMRLILARIIFDFDMRLADDGKNWIDRQRGFTLWELVPLNVHLTPVKR